MAPILTIYTPTYRRPGMLANCRASVEQQTARADVQHLVVVDEVGVGISGMYEEIPRRVPEMLGQYVYVLQDDDVLDDDEVVARLREVVAQQNLPAVVICRNRKWDRVYPLAERWRLRPFVGAIDLGSYIVRRDVFARHANDFGKRYTGDADFIIRLWDAGWPFYWWGEMFAREQLMGIGGRGRTEQQLMEAER